MATLKINNVVKNYGKKRAVDGLSLDIEDGEFFVILGPSGAGKTTTLKSIAGLVDIDEGEVHIGGRDVTLTEPYHRNVAMAFESYALYPQKTLKENLASPLKSGRSGRFTAAQQAERIDQVTTTLGVNHLQGRLPRELSNGQRQRVALGRVLVRPADVYLLDEPLSHLDAKLRASMRAELKAIGQMSNITTVYVTHDYQEALSLGNRIAVLREGKLIQVATPEEIWNRPADTFVAKSLGQPEINLFESEVENGRLVVPNSTISVPIHDGLGLRTGDRARIGIRPADISIHREAAGDDSTVSLPGKVVLSERLGRNIELTIDMGGTWLIGLARGGSLAEEGAEIVVHVPIWDVHVFRAAAAGEDSPRIGNLDPSGGSDLTHREYMASHPTVAALDQPVSVDEGGAA
jgi:multiple sugar transport system ATP-binding protein